MNTLSVLNAPTIIIGLIVLAIFIAVIYSMVRKQKKGGGCGCGCSGCANSSVCHPKK